MSDVAYTALRSYHTDVPVPDFNEYRKESTKDHREPSGKTIQH